MILFRSKTFPYILVFLAAYESSTGAHGEENSDKYWGLQMACKDNQATACFLLGQLSRDGGIMKDFPINLKKSREYFSNACDGGVILGCAELGYFLITGEGGEKNIQKGHRLMAKACVKDAKNATGWSSCYDFAFDLILGTSLDKDVKLAASVLSELCQSHSLPSAHSCVTLGKFYHLGTDIPKDSIQELKLYEKGCEKQSGEGCFLAGATHLMQENSQKAREYLNKGCSLKHEESCKWLEKH